MSKVSYIPIYRSYKTLGLLVVRKSKQLIHGETYARESSTQIVLDDDEIYIL